MLASDSFFVQLKASSVTQIEFTDEQVAWLFKLELPFFVASVDKANNSVRLFCCHRLSDALITNHSRKRVILHLSSEEKPDEFVAAASDDVYVGPPVLEWSIGDLQTEQTRTQFYDLCKMHVAVFREALETRRIGRTPYVLWKTNEPPRTVGWKTACSFPPGDQIEPVADLMMPYVAKILEESLRARDPRWVKTLKSLVDDYLGLIERFRAESVVTQPGGEAGG